MLFPYRPPWADNFLAKWRTAAQPAESSVLVDVEVTG